MKCLFGAVCGTCAAFFYSSASGGPRLPPAQQQGPLPPAAEVVVTTATAATSNNNVLQQRGDDGMPSHSELLSLASSSSQSSSSWRSSLSFPSSVAVAAADTTASAQQPPSSPSDADILLLRQAFAEFYASPETRDLDKSLDLLTQVVDKWRQQPADERAGLYRVRGDCHMQLTMPAEALEDYTAALKLLDGPGGELADPAELPAALLGRARAVKSQKGSSTPKALGQQAASDYKRAIMLASREEWDTDRELLEDGITRNPYAAWEYATMLRQIGQYEEAAAIHQLAADAFRDIGDKPRSAISLLDAGLDYAMMSDDNGGAAKSKAITLLKSAIERTKGVESRDVQLLQRVLAKEGEGRMALASLLWETGSGAEYSDRNAAESVLGIACERLEQMQAQDADYKLRQQQQSTDASAVASGVAPLQFSIDDLPSLEVSCYKFRDPKFLSDRLGWPESLQKKVIKLETLR